MKTQNDFENDFIKNPKIYQTPIMFQTQKILYPKVFKP